LSDQNGVRLTDAPGEHDWVVRAETASRCRQLPKRARPALTASRCAVDVSCRIELLHGSSPRQQPVLCPAPICRGSIWGQSLRPVGLVRLRPLTRGQWRTPSRPSWPLRGRSDRRVAGVRIGVRRGRASGHFNSDLPRCAPGGTRTPNQPGRNRLLYPLSYGRGEGVPKYVQNCVHRSVTKRGLKSSDPRVRVWRGSGPGFGPDAGRWGDRTPGCVGEQRSAELPVGVQGVSRAGPCTDIRSAAG
jgi:hypothetical protein